MLNTSGRNVKKKLPNVQAPQARQHRPNVEHKTIKGRDGFNYWMSGPQLGDSVVLPMRSKAPPEDDQSYLRDPINMINLEKPGTVMTQRITQSEVSCVIRSGLFERCARTESTIPLTRKVKGDMTEEITE